MRLAAVMVGGAAGAVARWALELAIPPLGGFPLATFLINVTGAFALGVVGVVLLEDGAWRYAAWNLALSGPLSFAGALAAFLAVR